MVYDGLWCQYRRDIELGETKPTTFLSLEAPLCIDA